MHTTRRFPRGVVATPHHLASSAGLEVLAGGGNAVDAAVAANLVLSVVTPYHCGPGGDLFALVWDGRVHAYDGCGRSAAAATRDRVAAATGGERPTLGGLTVTVPGAVRGWFDLLERWGTRSFGELATTATTYATEGFALSAHAATDHVRPARDTGYGAAWYERYGDLAAGDRLRQPGLGRLFDELAEGGPDAFYRGRVAADLVLAVAEDGGLLTADDLRAHDGRWVEPLRGTYRGVEVLELPPPTQGVTALTALGVLDRWELDSRDPKEATHLRIEATRAALADRDAHVADPATAPTEAAALLADARLDDLAARLDPSRVAPWPPARPDPGGTAYLCTADADGLLVSLIQSNFSGFGSGVVVPAWDLNLHNRGSSFSLDPDDVNVVAPRKRPRHTLIPALGLRDGAPWLVFGTMGGDGQAQTHVQLLGRLLDDGLGIQEALAAPRWFVVPFDGSVVLEERGDGTLAEALRARGHTVHLAPAWDHLFGHAHAIAVTRHGYAAGSDPRAEGAAVGR